MSSGLTFSGDDEREEFEQKVAESAEREAKGEDAMNNTKAMVTLAVVGIASWAFGADEWQTRLQSTIRQYDTNGVVVVEGGAYVYRYHTQIFKIHNVHKTGKVSETAHDEEGPNVDGVLLKVSLQDGPYRGAAEIPQNLGRAYWTTFINAYPVASGKYLWLSLSYGSQADKRLLEAVKTCLGPILPPQSGTVNQTIERPPSDVKAATSSETSRVDKKARSKMMWCHSCGMPLSGGFKGKSDIYCSHCTDKDGNFNVTHDEVLRAMAEWFTTWQPDIDDARATKRADHYLKAMPKWAEE